MKNAIYFCSSIFFISLKIFKNFHPMLFVELGREVSPLNKEFRSHKAVITGIKDSKMVIIQKQDKSFEIVRLKDLVLNDKVYDLATLADSGFFAPIPAETKSNDFERFKIRLTKQVEDELITSKFTPSK